MCSFTACNKIHNFLCNNYKMKLNSWLPSIIWIFCQAARRLKSKYNPFHVYIWYTYIMAWKIIYNPILVTIVFQLPSFVIDQNLQSFVWFSWFLSNIFCSKIYNPLFDQSNEFIHVFVFYYLSLLFPHLRYAWIFGLCGAEWT